MELEMRSQRRRSGRGFTLIEALLAAALFLLIVIAVLPLFTRAMVNNFAGRESTNVSNLARSRAEELLRLPFNSDPLTLQTGSELVTTDYRVNGADAWVATVDSGDVADWTRVTTIRQYSVTALNDNLLEVSESLPAGTPPGGVHFKEIQVSVASGRASDALGPPKSVTVRVLKSK